MKKIAVIIIITVLACALVFGGVLTALNWGRWFGDAPRGDTGSQTEPGKKPGLDPQCRRVCRTRN